MRVHCHKKITLYFCQMFLSRSKGVESKKKILLPIGANILKSFQIFKMQYLGLDQTSTNCSRYMHWFENRISML